MSWQTAGRRVRWTVEINSGVSGSSKRLRPRSRAASAGASDRHDRRVAYVLRLRARIRGPIVRIWQQQHSFFLGYQDVPPLTYHGRPKHQRSGRAYSRRPGISCQRKKKIMTHSHSPGSRQPAIPAVGFLQGALVRPNVPAVADFECGPGSAAFTRSAACRTFAEGATCMPMNTERRPVNATLKS